MEKACESLDQTETALRGRAKQFEAERGGVTPKSAAMTAEQQKIQELEARVNRLEREKPILKKSYYRFKWSTQQPYEIMG